MTWATQHVFINGELVRAEYLKSLWNNLDELHIPQSLYTRETSDNAQNYGSTTSSNFVNVNGSLLRGKVSLTKSRRVLITANLVSYASAGDTEGQLSLSIDGTTQGAGNGIYSVAWMDQPTMKPFTWVTGLLATGEHEFIIQHRRVVGTGTVNTAIFSRHWFYVVEL